MVNDVLPPQTHYQFCNDSNWLKGPLNYSMKWFESKNFSALGASQPNPSIYRIAKPVMKLINMLLIMIIGIFNV